VHAFSTSDIGPLLLGFFGAVLAGGVGLIAWRGDRLRSPGGIDAAVSREGAFLVNNLLFVGFAFVVLLGTVFPLLYEAWRGQQVTVGAPYFNAMAVPIGLALVFLMAIGPALPWRKASLGTLRDRLLVPAWVGSLVIVACVAGGVRGIAPLAAFGLGGFAAAANVRQLVLSARAAHRHGLGLWRGLVGRANGGMVVHLGVVVIAVALAAATSFGHRGQVTLRAGGGAESGGHRIAFDGLTHTRSPARSATEALVFVDGHGPLRPAVSQFGAGTAAVGTPAIDSSWRDDVYLTIDALPADPGGAVTIGVTVQPLVSWLWAGGALLVIGAALAAVPGRRRPATDPVSALVPPPRRTVGGANGHHPEPPTPAPSEGDGSVAPRDDPVGAPSP
jgi:cytochrome c-type biogenesis protein CcmF